MCGVKSVAVGSYVLFWSALLLLDFSAAAVALATKEEEEDDAGTSALEDVVTAAPSWTDASVSPGRLRFILGTRRRAHRDSVLLVA